MNEEPIIDTSKLGDTSVIDSEPSDSLRLEKIFGNLSQVTTVPTFTPRTFREGLALDTTAAKLYYYDFTNNVWKTVVTSAIRVGSTTASASIAIDTDSYDAYSVTTLNTDTTITTTGTPVNFQKLIVRIKDNGTARALTFSATYFLNYGVALPTTTVISKVLTVGFIYDSVVGKWGCVASAQE